MYKMSDLGAVDQTRKLFIEHAKKTRRLSDLHSKRLGQTINIINLVQTGGAGESESYALGQMMAARHAARLERKTKELAGEISIETHDRIARQQQRTDLFLEKVENELLRINQALKDNGVEEISRKIETVVSELGATKQNMDLFKASTSSTLESIRNDLDTVASMGKKSFYGYLTLRHARMSNSFKDIQYYIGMIPTAENIEVWKDIIPPKTGIFTIRSTFQEIDDLIKKIGIELSKLTSNTEVDKLQDILSKLESLDILLEQSKMKALLLISNEFEEFVGLLREKGYVSTEPTEPAKPLEGKAKQDALKKLVSILESAFKNNTALDDEQINDYNIAMETLRE